MKTKLYRCITILMLIMWMALIFSLSAQTASESDDTGAGFAYRLFSVIYPKFSEMTQASRLEFIMSINFYIRKAAHFSIYGVLGALSFLSVISYKKINYYIRVLISFIICVLYAASDEFHQRFVPGRSGELRDVLIDSAGSLLAILMFFAVTRISKRLYGRLSAKPLKIPSHQRNDKMRKKELWEQNNSLFDRLQASQLENKQLKIKLSALDEQLKALQQENEKLLEKISISAVTVDIEQPIAEISDSLEAVSEGASVAPAVLVQNEVPALEESDEEDMLSFASVVIGKIVVAAANYSNRLTAGGETRHKELVNLILGKTEVAKADILSVVTGEAEPNLQKQAINSVYEQACEYFESVMAQKE